MALNYATYITELTTLMVTQPTNQNFINIVPDIIDYAEQRIYRELNLIANQVRDSSASLTPNSRSFTLPQASGVYTTVSDVNVITPAATTVAAGSRTSLVPCALQFLDFLYPTEAAPTTPSIPALFAMVSDQIIAVGPAPDAAYRVEIVGIIRPTPLSVTNTSTYLTNYLPDLFVAASMVFASGYMRNFGAQADDPRMATSWETQYAALFASANSEEVRRRFNESFMQVPEQAQR